MEHEDRILLANIEVKATKFAKEHPDKSLDEAYGQGAWDTFSFLGSLSPEQALIAIKRFAQEVVGLD